MATPYNPYDANRSGALPSQQARYAQEKANRQANRPTGPKARPSHLKALAEARKVPRVRVEPRDDALRESLKHPNGMGFRSQGSSEWPLDSWTQRRVRDGSVRIVAGVKATEERTKGNHEQQQSKRKSEQSA